MLNIGNSPKLFINASIFLFFTLLLMFPKGYNYGSTALLVLSILFLASRYLSSLSSFLSKVFK